MERAVRQWALQLPIKVDEATTAALIKKLSKAYTIYGTMMLLPADTIDSDVFTTLSATLPGCNVSLYEHITRHNKVTHIAINRPIPLHSGVGSLKDNVMRAPVNFQPVFGDFGPVDCQRPPTQSDFDKAYWVTAKQNGIAQTWAPRWTMFSRGNITEKARVLQLPSVAEAVAQGRQDGRGCSAVDLYAGIGYFTFSYVKAGVSKVLCWELNDWSCEGLRRGAKANRWQVTTLSGESEVEAAFGTESIVLFNESNELALRRIASLRHSMPPVRHVNCGLLPTSQPSRHIAVASLDPELGGWIHVHENFADAEILDRAGIVRDEVQSLLKHETSNRFAALESITRVKTYAPGVWHCVIDIFVPPAPHVPGRD